MHFSRFCKQCFVLVMSNAKKNVFYLMWYMKISAANKGFSVGRQLCGRVTQRICWKSAGSLRELWRGVCAKHRKNLVFISNVHRINMDKNSTKIFYSNSEVI